MIDLMQRIHVLMYFFYSIPIIFSMQLKYLWNLQ